MVETFLSSPLMQEVVLPFVLVFAVVFAVLQKSEIFGKGKKQIDAIVALVISLIFVSFAQYVTFLSRLMPILAVSLVVILVFMILYGMVFKEGKFEMASGIQWVFFSIIAVVVIVSVLVLTGQWDYVKNLITGTGSGSDVATNVVLVVLVGAAIVVVLLGGKSGGEEKKESK